MKPQLRNKLSTISFKNESLQDLLKTCNESIEVLNIESIYGALDGGSKVSSIIVSKGLKAMGVLGGTHTLNYFFRSQTPPTRLIDRINLMPDTQYYVPTLEGWSSLPDVIDEYSQVTLNIYTPPEDAYSPHLVN